MERIKTVIVSDGQNVAVLLNENDITDSIDDITLLAIPGSETTLDFGRMDMHKAGSREDFFRRAGKILGYEVVAKPK